MKKIYKNKMFNISIFKKTRLITLKSHAARLDYKSRMLSNAQQCSQCSAMLCNAMLSNAMLSSAMLNNAELINHHRLCACNKLKMSIYAN